MTGCLVISVQTATHFELVTKTDFTHRLPLLIQNINFRFHIKNHHPILKMSQMINQRLSSKCSLIFYNLFS